jgi:hypothetical protein
MSGVKVRRRIKIKELKGQFERSVDAVGFHLHSFPESLSPMFTIQLCRKGFHLKTPPFRLN